jgi:hypothetical protein
VHGAIDDADALLRVPIREQLRVYNNFDVSSTHSRSTPFADAFDLLIDFGIFGSDLCVSWH